MRFFTFYIYFSLLLAIADGVSHTRGRSPFSRRLFGSKSSLPNTLIKTRDLFSFFNHLKSQGLENTEALDTIVKEFTHLHIFYYKVTTRNLSSESMTKKVKSYNSLKSYDFEVFDWLVTLTFDFFKKSKWLVTLTFD